MHHPPNLVSQHLIIALRLGCISSHPDIPRRDPPPASADFSLVLPTLDSQPSLPSPKLFHIVSYRLLLSLGHF